MKIRLFTKRTKKVNGHDHVALVDPDGHGQTLKSNSSHIHMVENSELLEENEHTHEFK